MNQNDEFDIENDLNRVDQEQKQQEQIENNTQYGVERMINCPKCGHPMKESARCCMRCGELNYLNSKNDSVKASFDLGKKLKEKEEKRDEKRNKFKLNNFKDSQGRTKNEKRFGFAKKLFTLLFIIFVIFVGINYKTVLSEFYNIRARHYIKQIDKIVSQIKEQYDNNDCETTSPDGAYYYTFEMSSDYYKTSISLFTFNEFTGSIKAVPKGNGEFDYYITISDGKYGMKDVLYTENMSVDVLKEINDLGSLNSHSVSCTKK